MSVRFVTIKNCILFICFFFFKVDLVKCTFISSPTLSVNINIYLGSILLREYLKYRNNHEYGVFHAKIVFNSENLISNGLTIPNSGGKFEPIVNQPIEKTYAMFFVNNRSIVDGFVDHCKGIVHEKEKKRIFNEVILQEIIFPMLNFEQICWIEPEQFEINVEKSDLQICKVEFPKSIEFCNVIQIENYNFSVPLLEEFDECSLEGACISACEVDKVGLNECSSLCLDLDTLPNFFNITNINGKDEIHFQVESSASKICPHIEKMGLFSSPMNIAFRTVFIISFVILALLVIFQNCNYESIFRMFDRMLEETILPQQKKEIQFSEKNTIVESIEKPNNHTNCEPKEPKELSVEKKEISDVIDTPKFENSNVERNVTPEIVEEIKLSKEEIEKIQENSKNVTQKVSADFRKIPVRKSESMNQKEKVEVSVQKKKFRKQREYKFGRRKPNQGWSQFNVKLKKEKQQPQIKIPPKINHFNRFERGYNKNVSPRIAKRKLSLNRFHSQNDIVAPRIVKRKLSLTRFSSQNDLVFEKRKSQPNVGVIGQKQPKQFYWSQFSPNHSREADYGWKAIQKFIPSKKNFSLFESRNIIVRRNSMEKKNGPNVQKRHSYEPYKNGTTRKKYKRRSFNQNQRTKRGGKKPRVRTNKRYYYSNKTNYTKDKLFRILKRPTQNPKKPTQEEEFSLFSTSTISSTSI